jgi:hypothetical protein
VSRRDGEQVDEFLFDLAKDPGEANNLIQTKPKQARPLKKLLADWEQEMKGP